MTAPHSDPHQNSRTDGADLSRVSAHSEVTNAAGRLDRFDRLVQNVERSHAQHQRRHTRTHRLLLAFAATLLYVIILVLWSTHQIADSWDAALKTWPGAILYGTLIAAFVVFFVVMHRLTLSLDGVNRLPLDRLDELQREVRQRSSDQTLSILLWTIVAIFIAAMLLQQLSLPDQMPFNLLICAVYALLGISLFSSSFLTAIWLPDQDATDLREGAPAREDETTGGAR